MPAGGNGNAQPQVFLVTTLPLSVVTPMEPTAHSIQAAAHQSTILSRLASMTIPNTAVPVVRQASNTPKMFINGQTVVSSALGLQAAVFCRSLSADPRHPPRAHRHRQAPVRHYPCHISARMILNGVIKSTTMQIL